MRAENENWGDTVRNHLFDQRSAVMVHWLILLNVVIFILGFFFQVDIPRNIYPPVHLDLIQLYGAYSEYTCFHEGELWRFLTLSFINNSSATRQAEISYAGFFFEKKKNRVTQ